MGSVVGWALKGCSEWKETRVPLLSQLKGLGMWREDFKGMIVVAILPTRLHLLLLLLLLLVLLPQLQPLLLMHQTSSLVAAWVSIVVWMHWVMREKAPTS